MSQTLSFSSTWPLVASAILVLDLYKKAEHRNDGQAWADGKCSSHGPLLGFFGCSQNELHLCTEDLSFETWLMSTARLRHFCHHDIAKLMIPLHPVIHYFRM